MDFRKQLRLNAEIDRFAEESLLRLGITVLFRQAKPFTQRCDQRGLTWVARSAGRRACHHQSAISASVWESISQRCCRSIPSSWPAHPQTDVHPVSGDSRPRLNQLTERSCHRRRTQRTDRFHLDIGTGLMTAGEGHRNACLQKRHHVSLRLARLIGQLRRKLLQQSRSVFQCWKRRAHIDQRHRLKNAGRSLALSSHECQALDVDLIEIFPKAKTINLNNSNKERLINFTQK